jgi:hypothetical protein
MRILQAVAAAIAAETAYICQAQTTAGAGYLTLNGDGVTTYNAPGQPSAYQVVEPSLAASGDFQGGTPIVVTRAAILNPPRPVSITSASDEAGVSFTVSGYDRVGLPISETITGPNDDTVNTLRLFAVVTSVYASAEVSNNVSVGWDGSSYSRWINLGNQRGHYQHKIVVLAAAADSEDIFLQVTSMPMNRVMAIAGATGNATGRSAYSGNGDDTGGLWLGGDLPDDLQQIGGTYLTLTEYGLNTYAYEYVSDNSDPWAAVRVKVAGGTNSQVVLRVIPTRTA